MSKISEVNMVVDKKEVILNEIFYKANPIKMGSRYKESFQGRGQVEIEPWRVISVNTSARRFRIRNTKGCEQEYSLKDGCICDNLYSTLIGARARAHEIFQEDIDNHDKELRDLDKVKESKKELISKQRKCKTLVVGKLPVRVKER